MAYFTKTKYLKKKIFNILLTKYVQIVKNSDGEH